VDKSTIGEGLQWVRARFAAIVVGGALRVRALSRNAALPGGMLAERSIVGGSHD
jgi:hypothetical protein